MEPVSVDLSVVAPCLDEEANVGALTERVLGATAAAGIRSEVVLVDDGSADRTWAAIAELQERFGHAVVGIRHATNSGIPAGWRTGVNAARGRYVCLIDADLQNPPEEVVTLYERLMESRADLAQGTRSSIARERDSRFVFSRGLNLLLNATFRQRAKDSKSGFVLGPRSVVADVIGHRRKYRYFQTFLGVAARAKGYRVLEVETLFESRRAGTSFLAHSAWETSARALADFPQAIAEYGLTRHPHRASIGPVSASRPSAPHPYRGARRLLFETYFSTLPLHTWKITRRTRDLYLQLKQSERASRSELDGLQAQKLTRLLQHAYSHVRYYREVMDAAGIHPADIPSPADLGRMPLLTKDTVRKRLHFDLFADDHRKRDMLRVRTSGSTGEPFVTYADRYQLEMRFATTLRALEWTGWRMGDRQARLWHQTIGMNRTQQMRERIDAALLRRRFVPAFEISPETLESYLQELREWDPVLVDGYAESLNFLATYVKQGGDPGFRPRAMMSSAQMLPEHTRAVIEDAFGTRVFDKYGSREFSGIAYECEAARDHHVMDESYIVEILVDGRPAEPGETGEVVVTDLNNYSVPLIRYRIGDLAVAVDNGAPCPCGRNLSRIGSIDGRTQAIVVCADGTWLPGTFFAHLMKDYEHLIRFYQVYQREPGAFTLRVVPNVQYNEAGMAELTATLSTFTGADTRIDVELVDEIPLGSTGKRSPVISDVELDFQTIAGERNRIAPGR